MTNHFEKMKKQVFIRISIIIIMIQNNITIMKMILTYLFNIIMSTYMQTILAKLCQCKKNTLLASIFYRTIDLNNKCWSFKILSWSVYSKSILRNPLNKKTIWLHVRTDECLLLTPITKFPHMKKSICIHKN